MTSIEMVNRLKIWPSPSPNTICSPFQKALLYLLPKWQVAFSGSPSSSIELRPYLSK